MKNLSTGWVHHPKMPRGEYIARIGKAAKDSGDPPVRTFILECLNALNLIDRLNGITGKDATTLYQATLDLLEKKRSTMTHPGTALSIEAFQQAYANCERQATDFGVEFVGDMLLRVSPSHVSGAAGDLVSTMFANLGKQGYPNTQVEPQFDSGPSMYFAPATVDTNGVVNKVNFFMLIIQMAMPSSEEKLNIGHRQWHMYDRRTDDRSVGWYSSILHSSAQFTPSVCMETSQWVTAKVTAKMR